jgi:Na+-transporting NADH:ubiquinone oxidoreductase subunit C
MSEAKNTTLYTIGFAAAVCVVCSVFVAASAVGLADRQEENLRVDRQRNVLLATGLLGLDEEVDKAEIQDRFAQAIQPVAIELETGQEAADIDIEKFDPIAAESNAKTSRPAPANDAKVLRLPKHALVYEVKKNGVLDMIVLPVHGKGLWSTMRAYLALEADTRTVRGVAFYQQAETPGLGAEVASPAFTGLWVGRKVLDERFEPKFKVVRGQAGSVQQAPHEVDGLSGATLTCNGVTALVNFWLGKDGFGPYLAQVRQRRGQ